MRTPDERFWVRVDKTETCWLWTAARTDGYGRFRLADRMAYAHRFAHELLVGPIPDDREIDHLCRVRHCVNPAHMELVTSRENTLRGEGHAARNAAMALCPKGHPLVEGNLRLSQLRRGKRACLPCDREDARRRQAPKQQRAPGVRDVG